MVTLKRNHWKEDSAFLIRLAELLEKGFPLETAINYLSITAKQNKKRYLRITEHLNQGLVFSDALEKCDFPSFCIAPIYFSTEHGYFSETIRDVGLLLEQKFTHQKALVKTIQYPAILLATVLLVFILLRLFLMPKFKLLFSQLAQSDTKSNQLSSFLFDRLPIVLLGSLLLLTILVLFVHHKLQKQPLRKQYNLMGRLPLSRYFFQIHYSQLFARECGYLLQSGLSIQKIFQLFYSPHATSFFQEISNELRQQLVLGKPFSESLATLPYLEEEFIQIVQHGERNGTLANELIFYYQQCQSRLMEKITQVLSWIQPCVFLFIGIFIVSIYLSILLPMFSMVDQI
ncbi:competence type IV pilus assembly protein ComGB [Listeria ilorinensis]|uniref:competence type IV pilus assembly protein ComGB n=1 Tax=Listeria ilorinensis TaxID=2867439 RepID=UPI001EF4D9E0|nr:competence type IV pilus assembly protein ComGB [Listeria ilorinensis]